MIILNAAYCANHYRTEDEALEYWQIRHGSKQGSSFYAKFSDFRNNSCSNLVLELVLVFVINLHRKKENEYEKR